MMIMMMTMGITHLAMNYTNMYLYNIHNTYIHNINNKHIICVYVIIISDE